MSEYTTLVFKTSTTAGKGFARRVAQDDLCVAWSMDHEILRLELIEQALESDDIDLAKFYINAANIEKFKDRLK